MTDSAGPSPTTDAKPVGGKPAKKPKENTLHLASTVHRNGIMVETIHDASLDPPHQFLMWWPTGEHQTTECYADGLRVVRPYADPHGLIQNGAILLPAAAARPGSLIPDMQAFIRRYCDMDDFWVELCAHYALMTWVFDRFAALPYLRFLGEPATGKTRMLQVVANLCNRAIVMGGSTSGPVLFRLLNEYRGTLAMDEADYKDSDLYSDIVKILNSGYAAGLPVYRCEKIMTDGHEDQTGKSFQVFGPKILTTRREFEDAALESRCITLHTGLRAVRQDIRRQLPKEFHTEALLLRNRALQWRFEQFTNIDLCEDALLNLEPRSAQIGLCLYAVAQDPGFKAQLLKFLGDRSDTQRRDSPAAVVAEAIRQCAVNAWEPISVKDVAEMADRVSEQWETGREKPWSPKTIGPLIRSHGFTLSRGKSGRYEFQPDAAILDLLRKKYDLPDF